MISIEQIKAARALLDWTQDDLAMRAGLSKPSVNTLERRIANPRMETMTAIQKAMENAGIEFTDGSGVKLRSTTLNSAVFEGEDAIIRLYIDIFDTLVGTGKALLVNGIAEEKYQFTGGAKILDEVERRLKHKIPTKLLSCEGDTNFIEPITHYRWLPEAFFPNVTSFVYDNKYALLLPGQPAKAVIIENQDIAETYRQQFTALWHAAKVPVV